MKKILVLLIMLNAAFGLSQNSAIQTLLQKEKIAIKSLPLSITSPVPNQHLARQVDEKLDSTYNWSWNAEIGEWELQNRTYYETDDQGRITKETIIVFDGAEWINSFMNVYNYDDVNHTITTESYQWETDMWSIAISSIETYDAMDNILETLYLSWDGAMWVNSSRTLYIYEAGKLIRVENDAWDGNEWVPEDQTIYDYGTTDLVQSFLGQQYVNNVWEDAFRGTYFYDGMDRISMLVAESLVSPGVWEPSIRYLYEYGTGTVTLTFQQYENNEWVNFIQANTVYNKNLNNAIYSQTVRLWADEWLPLDSTQYYYSPLLAVSSPDQAKALQLYPNPVTQTINLDASNVDMSVNSSLLIFSSVGMPVTSFHLTAKEMIGLDVSFLPPGQYHLMIMQDNLSRVGSFIKQ